MSEEQGKYTGIANPRSMFVEGPFGAGKTSFAIETLFAWLEGGIAPEKILVLVPQRTLSRRYLLALRDSRRGPPGDVEIRTPGGLAKDVSGLYWPMVAAEAGFKQPQRPPRFLTIETSQYAMARFVDEAVQMGKFDAINVSPQQIARQIIDNMGKAALMGIDYRLVPDLLSAAWGKERKDWRKRDLVYRATGEVAQAYRAYCLEHRLLDYALQVELFNRMLARPDFREAFFSRRTHLIVEHVEEESPLTHDLIAAWLPRLEGALLTYEWDSGYRVFLGAAPEDGHRLRERCEGILVLDRSRVMSPGMEALQREVAYSLRRAPDPAGDGSQPAFRFQFNSYYPEMIGWVADTIQHLVEDEGVAPREIAVLAPFLSDALRFSLGQALDARGIPHLSHRPSRALRDEPAARALLALAALAHPHWFQANPAQRMPPQSDVAHALEQAIAGLDPVRARLLAKVVYRPGGEDVLTAWDRIQPEMQARITYLVGERYMRLRSWLLDYRAGEVAALDHVFRRLFDEVLARPGFGFHDDPEAGRVTAELVESAQKFRQALSTDARPDLNEVGRRYLSIVEQGLLAALYVASWRDELADAVFMAPAYTFLLRNRAVDVQFWLDVGSLGWWERLDQPLTHPYVLSRAWPQGQMWADSDEYERQQDMLYRIMSGLVRRCRREVYLGISDLGEQGYEQRGPMLRIFQQILRRHPHEEQV